MKILVTGGAGFIGGNFIHYMIEKYPQDVIVNLDALTYAGNLETVEPVKNAPNYRFTHGDISDRILLKELFGREKFDIVVNFAAESHVDRSITNPGLFVQTNVIGTQVLLDMALEHGIKRFHQVSTDEVYGDLPLDRKDLLFTEDTPLCPSSPYSASKASADLLVMAYGRTYGLPVTISRCSNNYGPYQFPEKLIPLMITRAMNDQPLPVYGKGINVRDWLYVLDHCEAVDTILRQGKPGEPGEPGEIYNIGGNNEMSNLEVVHILLDILQKPRDLITFVTDRKGHDLRYAINAGKMKKDFGWSPGYNFERGIAATVQWYKNNPEWLENILSGRYLKYIEEQYGAITEKGGV
ncbi:MAG: dTDP-glucose 4,6-dehydratase [Oscillospiraceae bacterium]|nr:dTDP-glucose 4,6-dehydratase [Oscillospiraceae bacterium]